MPLLLRDLCLLVSVCGYRSLADCRNTWKMGRMNLFVYGLVLLSGLVEVAQVAGSSVAVVKSENNHDSPSRKLKRRDAGMEPFVSTMSIESNVSIRFAEVQVRTTIENPNDESVERTFKIQISEVAFISLFSLTIGGLLHVSEVKGADEATKIYDQAQKDNLTAGMVFKAPETAEEKASRGMDYFSMNVNVAPQSSVDIELRYLEVLERRAGLYRQRISVKPTQVVQNLVVSCEFNEPQGIKTFDFQTPTSATVRAGEVAVSEDSTYRRLVYTPSEASQSETNGATGMDGEIDIQYDVEHEEDGGYLVIGDGFFAHFFSPDCSDFLKKTILFIIDVSGSMSGMKIQKAVAAFVNIVAQLREGDFFNVLLFSEDVIAWRSEFVPASDVNIRQAQLYARRAMNAAGGTNIQAALVTGIQLFKDVGDTVKRSTTIFFLTDGSPTKGITDTKTIRRSVKAANQLGDNEGERWATIISIGFGEELNFGFLQAVSWENGGFARRVYVDTDAAEQLQDLFLEISDPAYLDLEFEYRPDRDLSVTQATFPQYFCGSEIIVAGEIGAQEADDLNVTVIGTGTVNDVQLRPQITRGRSVAIKANLIERLHAYWEIKDLLKRASIARDKRSKTDLESRALDLSLKYQFVTPVTSLVVHEVRPEKVFPSAGGIGRAGASIKSWSGNGLSNNIPIFTDPFPRQSTLGPDFSRVSFANGLRPGFVCWPFVLLSALFLV